MSISEGDHFSIHFVKHTTVVAIECENGNKFNVPLNSAVHFGLLYDPYDNYSEAVKGYKFEKVSDILRMGKLPLVVRARKGHQGSNPESSIAANELLVVRKVRTKLMGRKELKLYSITTGKEKTLNDNCIGHFSTKPREVSMYLPEIVKHIPDVFPCKAVLFNVAGSAPLCLPSKLSIAAVTLMHSSINTSLVATSVLEQDLENAKLLDIPIDLDILVRVVGTSEMEAWRLHKDTSYLYNNFNPANLCPYVSKATSRSAHQAQSRFYMNVCPEQKEGIKVTKPQTIETPSHYQCPRPVVGDSKCRAIENIHHPPDRRNSSPSLPDTDHKSEASVCVSPSGQSSPRRRTPGYSYVETNPVISARPLQPDKSSNSLRLPAAGDPSHCAQNFVITSDTAQSMSSFGSTGSGGAVVERIQNESLGDDRRPESMFLDDVITEFQQISQELDSALVQESCELEAIEEADNVQREHNEKGIENGGEETGVVPPKLPPRFKFSPSDTEANGCEMRQEVVTRNRKYLSQMDAAQVSRWPIETSSVCILLRGHSTYCSFAISSNRNLGRATGSSFFTPMPHILLGSYMVHILGKL